MMDPTKALWIAIAVFVTITVGFIDGKPQPLSRSKRATPCDSNPCLNGGICSEDATKYTCECTKKYIGVNCEKECAPVDICLIMDTSASITLTNWDGSVVPFVEALITNMTIGLDETRIGAVGFSDISHYFWKLDTYSTESELLGAVKGIDYMSLRGATNSPAGIKLGETEIFQKSEGDRDNAQNIAIFFNDGACNKECDKLTQYSDELKANRQTTVYSVAVGANVALAEVKQVASDPDSEFLLLPKEFSDLLNFVDIIKEGICKYSAPPNPCDPNPCKNNGQCADDNGAAKCTCAAGYSGDTCETNIDECASSPCVNGKCTDKVNKYVCACDPNWTGANCDTFDPCSPDPCKNGGQCANVNDKAECTCAAGYEGATCETNIDECASSPCVNGACKDRVNKFTCTCDPNWTGTLCDTFDPCSPDPCKNGGQCANVNDNAECTCAAGYSGAICATNIDECASFPCLNGACVDKVNKFTCTCDVGWSGTLCDAFNPCDPSPCKNGGQCANVNDKAECTCAAGYTGATCTTNIDECASSPCVQGTCNDKVNKFTCTCDVGWSGTLCDAFNPCDPSPCKNGGQCANVNDKAECTCAAGYSGATCETNIDECASSPCLNGACVDKVNKYICTCDANWTGTICDTFDPCSPDPCKNGGQCANVNDKAECTCAAGYSGATCETNIDECASSPCVQGTCNDKVNKFTCTCDVGWSGTLCDTEDNPCASNPCQNGAQCSIKTGNFECACVPGYSGTQCETDIDECASNPCVNGVCEDKVNQFTCTCDNGWYGAICDEADPCKPNPCKNGGTCADNNGNAVCTCKAGYDGPWCGNDIDDCASSPCVTGNCNDKINSYECICDAGYEGVNCDKVIDTCLSNPCTNGACKNNAGISYTCTCDAGWTGTNCDTQIDNCVSGPCKNGAQCTSGLNSVTCTCKPGYTGKYCDIDIDECLSSPCKNGGVCTNEVNKYTCTCATGWKGDNCQNRDNNCDADDICFVLDSSASLQLANWENVKLFTNKIIEDFAIGPNDVQVGIVVYSSTSSTPIRLNNGMSKAQLQQQISALAFVQTGTATHLGLNDVKDICFKNAGDRSTSRNKAFLITDGRSVSPVETSSAALAARNAGISIFAIGVGRASPDELLAITGNDAGKVFMAPDFTTLLSSVSKIIGDSCDPLQEADGCGSSPCQNNGKCINNMGQYNCNCSNSLGFTGTKCEVAPSKDDCDHNDVCFLVDASSSIPPYQEWTDMLNFVTSVVAGLPDTTTVGMVLFSLDATLHIPLGSITDRNALIQKISSTTRTGGSTMTHLGLDAIKTQCLAGPNYHSNTYNKVFLVTDGKSKDTDLTAQAALSLRQKADVFAVGVGRYNYTELTLITGDTSKIFTALRFSDLPGIASTVLAGSCKEADLCQPNPCQNSGACTSSGSTFSCTCLSGWTGTVCDIPVDACSSKPCQNGAQCNPQGATSYTCTCSSEWTGTNCDIKMTNECTKDDVCLLVDASGSILPSQWIQVKDFLKTLIGEWPIGPADVQVGIVVYSSYATVAWSLNTYHDKTTLTSKVDTLTHYRMGTATDVGLDLIRTGCFGGPGNRPNPDKMFLMTDGRSIDKTLTLEAARKLRDQQVDLYVIGVGDRLDNSELLGITGNDASKLIISQSFDNLAASVSSLVQASCSSQSGPADDPCNPNPCNNGGACSANSSVFTCQCPVGYSGQTCETNTNECGSNPCQNGGVCIDGNGGYFCACVNSFQGEHCQTPGGK